MKASLEAEWYELVRKHALGTATAGEMKRLEFLQRKRRLKPTKGELRARRAMHRQVNRLLKKIQKMIDRDYLGGFRVD